MLNMKKWLWFAALLISAAGCTPSDPKEVLKRVDDRIYYPEQSGLKSLSCRVSSPYIGEMFSRLAQQVPGSREMLDALKVETYFYWRAGYGSKFVIAGIPDSLPDLRNSVSEVFQGTEILIMPSTEQEQFSSFNLSLQKENGKLTVVGKNPDPQSDFVQYDLMVKPRSWLITGRKFYSKGSVSDSRPYFEVWKGKCCMTRIETVHEEGSEASFRSLVEMEYQEAGGYRLLKKMTYTYTKLSTGDKMIGPVELDFSDYKINQGINIDLFKGGKIMFLNPEPSPQAAPGPQTPEKRAPYSPSRGAPSKSPVAK